LYILCHCLKKCLTVQNPKKGQALTEEEAALSHASGMPKEALIFLIAGASDEMTLQPGRDP
jgi:hypothetical protein